MKYCLANVLPPPFATYHRSMVSGIADRFPSIIETREQAIPTHFTLKYDFETASIAEVELVLEKFTRSHRRTDLSIGGFDQFGQSVIFVPVVLSPAAHAVFDDLIDALHGFSWMEWQEHDGKDMHFHSTIAEECEGLTSQVRGFLEGKERSFDGHFNNITVFVETGKTAHGYRTLGIHKRFDFLS